MQRVVHGKEEHERVGGIFQDREPDACYEKLSFEKVLGSSIEKCCQSAPLLPEQSAWNAGDVAE